MDATHDPQRRSFVASADGHADFPIQNLPLGIFSPRGGEARGGVAIGDSILDLPAVAHLLSGDAKRAAEAAAGDALNGLFALGAGPRRALRAALSDLLATGSAQQAAVRPNLHDATDCTLHLPARIGDYTDFFAGIHHASNAGKLFRPENPLLPNYRYVPVAYHGRASSVRVSGSAVRRPKGQRKPANETVPSYGPSRNLDYEMEFGIWVGTGNAQGEPIPIAEAAKHIAGFCLLNDWSARDVQGWEAQPLGPFLAKNFHTSISPWVVTPEALAPFRIAQAPRPDGDPKPLDYLWDEADQAQGALDLAVEVSLVTRQGGPFRLSLSNTSHLYWTFAQMVAHHSCGGCNLAPGDLFGSGTISSPTEDGFGALLEITQGGRKPITLPNGEERRFLEDGDTVVFRAQAKRDGYVTIGFGECRGTVLPAT
ncbi:fumarylacetoacetase [Dankookia sp. GCM10030260]|uniref:fumarylacetoacetase n=1 Tax=Dankookia sp. GCM10030260 TaxID=3273390 RepID=UPI0036245488